MKEHPIIMGGSSIRAILDGRKSQTRRIIKPQPWHGGSLWKWTKRGRVDDIEEFMRMDRVVWDDRYVPIGLSQFCPYGQVGDILWCRETWKPSFTEYDETGSGHGGPDDPCCGYKATMTYTCGEPVPDYPITWKSPIYMPKKYARIWLEATDVRAEQLQEISERDVYAEGCPLEPTAPHPIAWFRDLWNSLNAKRGYAWETDPWVWVVSFQVL